MKKVFAVAKVAAIVNVFLFFTLLFTTCGGGAAGGAGGASIPDSEYSTHNAGGWGGGGNSGGSGGSGSGGNGVNMTGGTPLFVERYEDPVTGTFAGSQLNDLIAAIQNNSSRSNSVFNIPFYVVGDPVVRQARVTKGRTKVEKFEHQYKATCSIPPSTTTSVFYYYVEEGINLASITTAEMTGWQCQEDGSVHNGSHITNITGDVTLVPVYTSGAGPINGGVIRTDLHTGAVPPVSETFDYQTLAGTTVSGSVVYITVPPLTAGTVLYTENGNNVTVSGYNVHFNINSVPFAVTFNPGDTQSKVIENIPLGANISMNAIIDVSDGNGYTVLNTETVSLTAQAGGGATMYTEYPLSCYIGDLFTSGGAAITGSSYPSYYTNNGTPTDISSAAPTPSYTNPGNPPQTMYFAGWALNSTATAPVIAGNIIPADGTYKGALNLYAVYNSCSVSINEPSTHVISEGANDYQLTLNATSNGFSSPVTYTWSVENQNANTAVAVNSSTGLVTIVPGKTGTEIVKVTATDGTYTATNTISISVVALSLPADPIVLLVGDTDTAINGSLLGGYTGSVTYTWSKNPSTGSSVNLSNTTTTNPSNTVTPTAGGKTTITVTPCIDGTQYLGPKTIDVYVFDLQLTGGTDTIVTETPSSFSANADYDFIMDASRVTGGTLTAHLANISDSEVSFTWENNATELGTFGTINSSGNSCTITPNGTTGYYVIDVQASITGVAGTTKVFKVRYKTLGLQFTNTSPTAISKTATSAAEKTMTVEVKGFSSGDSVSWGDWVSSATSVALKGTETKPANTDTATLVLTPLTGGKTTVSMSATIGIGANTLTLNATKDVYILDLVLTGDGLNEANGDYALMTTMNNTSGTAVSASLLGTGMPGTTFTWALGSGSSTVLELQGSNNDSRTIKPKAAGTETVTVSTSYGGVTVSKTINVVVLGLSLTEGPIVLTPESNGQTIAASVSSYGGGIIYNWQTEGSSATLSDPTSTGPTQTITPSTGGKTTITVTATIQATNTQLPSKSIDVYVLDLTLSGSSGAEVVNSTDANIDYNLIMNAADTTGKELTASLAGFTSGVTYTWTQPSPYATLNGTNGAQKVIQSTGTAGSTDFTLTASITGVAGASITKTIKLKAAGLTLEGDDTLYYNPNDATHRLSLALTPVGGISLDYITGDPSAYSSSNTSVATASLANSGATCYVNGQNGGSANITVKAKISGTDIVLTAIKQVTILKLDITGLPIYPSYSDLQLGQSQEVTAVLTGASDPSTVTYTWEYTGSDLILSATTGSTITVTPMSGAGSPKTLSVTATMSGTNYGPITLGVMPTNLTAAYLSYYLDNLPTGDPDNPTVIPAIVFEQAEVNTIKDILRDTYTYIDLSATTMPSGVVDGCFSWCPTITTAPSIPEGVTSMRNCFDHGECTSHLSGPSTIVIPSTVTDMYKCFFKCTALQNVRIIVKANITDASKWAKAFMHITSSQNVRVYVTSNPVKNAIVSESYSDGGVPNSESNAGVNIIVGIPAGY
ncbi:MAG: hypothetical protein J6T84_02410 [Spirochaetaceae bacterium]|nr:hypothetical protein [Spirochaetaceae bacterium]